MKKLLTVVTFFLIIGNLYGQDTTTIYFNANWKKTKESKATYKRITIKYLDHYKVIETLIDNDTLTSLELKSIKPDIEQGLCNYYETGSVIAKGYYSDGYLDKLWIVKRHGYFDSLNYEGIKDIYLNKKEGFSDSTFMISEEMPMFLSDVNVSELRESNKKKVAEVINLLSTFKNEKDPKFISVWSNYAELQQERITIERQSFKGFIDKNLFYPIRSKKIGVQGTVYIQIVINQVGKIIEPKIIRGVEKDLDCEAIRLVLNSPAWIPGKQNGKEVKVAIIIPIEFKL
jgi:TonB family protein